MDLNLFGNYEITNVQYYADCINHDELKSFVESVEEYSKSFEESKSTIYNDNNMKIFY